MMWRWQGDWLLYKDPITGGEFRWHVKMLRIFRWSTAGNPVRLGMAGT